MSENIVNGKLLVLETENLAKEREVNEELHEIITELQNEISSNAQMDTPEFN